MRRVFAVVLCSFIVLAMTGCGSENTVAPEPVVTAEPTPEPTPEPETSPATVCVLRAPAILAQLSRGDAVEVTGEQDEFYVVKTDSGTGFVEKRLLRGSNQPAYEEWPGYARANAPLYADYHMSGEALQLLSQNTTMQVLADLGDCYLVEGEEFTGYVPTSEVSDAEIYVYWGGGGGGGGGGADGGDITLGYHIPEQGRIVLLSAEASAPPVQGTAYALADSVEVISDFYSLGDTVGVLDEDGEWCNLYSNGVFSKMEKRFLRLSDESEFATWDGFANYNACLYDNYYLTGEPIDTPSLNTQIRVLFDLGNCLLVEVGETTAYIASEFVSETQVYVNWGGGGGGGGAEWTEPTF